VTDVRGFPYLSVVPLAAIFLAFILGLVVFVLRGGGRRLAPSARLEAQGHSALLGRVAAEFGLWFMRGPVQLFTRLRVAPDAISRFGLALTLGAGVALGCGWFGLGGWLFLVGGMLDSSDGKPRPRTRR
jgi:hypothetical protein